MEATGRGLDLAREQGAALGKTLQYMTQEVAQHGNELAAGDYLVGYAVEDAEGLYFWREGKLEWEEPREDNVHLEVSVRDGADGRFVPELEVFATLIGADGTEIGTHRQSFLWHPWLYHYGRNWTVPEGGDYTLRVRIEPPAFPRHDKINGKRYTRPVSVEFRDVRIETGRK
jgi:hypothetical protein